jgi:hypothetical protein
LYIFSATFAHEQRTFRIFLQVMSVLSDAADKDQGPTLLVQAVWNDGAERKAGH